MSFFTSLQGARQDNSDDFLSTAGKLRQFNREYNPNNTSNEQRVPGTFAYFPPADDQTQIDDAAKALKGFQNTSLGQTYTNNNQPVAPFVHFPKFYTGYS